MTSSAIPQTTPERKRSLIGEDVRITGSLTTRGILEFGGEIRGELTADTLVLTRTARVHGKIRARHLTIEGTLQGSAAALNLTLRPSAIVSADLTCERICIEPGAQIGGRIGKLAAYDLGIHASGSASA